MGSSSPTEDARMAMLRFKANYKVFKLMDDVGIGRLAHVGKAATFRAGATIIREGELGDTLYMIIHGGVRVMTEGIDEPQEVARLAAGQFFGEMAVLNDEPRTASVMSIGETRCLAFEKHDVLAILQDYPNIRQVLGLVGLKRAEQLLDVQLK